MNYFIMLYFIIIYFGLTITIYNYNSDVAKKHTEKMM